ncbi:glycosidase [Candidatus Parcubacteria bacterium]|nr:MAG: glycosidase [Candidatus Parcubacteria bacterium]
MYLQRHPANPILTPYPLHPWEALNVFNAAVVHHLGLFHMLYRAQGLDYVSHIGYAVSEDGVHWSQLNKPVLSPDAPWETRGVEDPRITKIDDVFYMTYTGYSHTGTRACLARSTNLIKWERMGIVLPNENNKDHVLFPEKINGRYAMLHRRPPSIWLTYSDDLIHWTDHQILMQPHPNTWEHKKIGAGGPPIKTSKGWLIIYHAVDANQVYRLGAALCDLENPSRIIARLPEPILEPHETWEIRGDVPHVVFSCANVVVNDTLFVFYGGADRVMALATCSLQALLDALQKATHR